MGGTEAIILSTIGSIVASTQKKPNSSGNLERERAAREEEQRQREAEDRRRDRAKVVEARQIEEKRKHNRSTLSKGAASLVEELEEDKPKLKQLLGE